MNNLVTVISFSTTKSDLLIKDCKNLGLNYSIQDTVFIGDWESNILVKPILIRSMLNKHSHILWVNPHSRIVRSPDRIQMQVHDIAITKSKAEGDICYKSQVDGDIRYNGDIIGMLSNYHTISFVDDWVRMCKICKSSEEAFNMAIKSSRNKNLSIKVFSEDYYEYI